MASLKKTTACFLAATLTLGFCACGTDMSKENENGKLVNAEEASAVMTGIKLRTDEMNVEGLGKLSYVLKMDVDGGITTNKVDFSKADNYFRSCIIQENIKVEKGYEEEYKEYLGTIHHNWTNLYHYIDEQDQRIFATNTYSDATLKDEETGEFKRSQSDEKGYKILSETTEDSEAGFHNSILTQLSDFLSQYLEYTSQAMVILEPFVSVGTTPVGPLLMEVRSKGEGHLFFKYDMLSTLGVYQELEFNGYELTYMKTVTDNTVTGITAAGFNKSTIEIFFKNGQCDFEYPNLSEYTLLQS